MSGCTLLLDNFHGYFIPGSTIAGRVVCTFRKPKNIRGVRIKLWGTEHTAWTESESYRDHLRNETRRREVFYSGDNTILAVETVLTGGGDIGPGVFEYPFTFVLPKNLPGTYYGRYGWIRYSMKATVDRPYHFDYTYDVDLNIIGLVDFNDMAPILQLGPVGYSDMKTLCCCCCKSGPITMTVQLEKEAFVQGETVNVKVDISNMSNKNVDGVEVEIERRIESRVLHPAPRVREDYERLAISKESGVDAHGERNYSFLMEIPRTATLPNFTLCTLFAQWYRLRVKAVLPFSHLNLKVSTNIVLGHIPVGGLVHSVSFDHIASLIPNPPPQGEAYPYPPGASYPPTAGTQFPFQTNAPSHVFPVPLTSDSSSSKPFPNPQAYPMPSAPNAEGATAPSQSELFMGDNVHRLPPPTYEDAIHSK